MVLEFEDKTFAYWLIEFDESSFLTKTEFVAYLLDFEEKLTIKYDKLKNKLADVRILRLKLLEKK